MKNIKVQRSINYPAVSSRLGCAILSRSLLFFAVLLISTTIGRTQTLQLRFPFMQTHGSGTTTPSDTSSGGISAAMTMYNPAGTVATDLNGAAGTGVTNNVAVNNTAAMDFTTNYTPSQTNQPAASNAGDTANGNGVVAVDLADATLGSSLGSGGTISQFVITMWFKQQAMIPNGGTVGPRLWILNAGSAGVDSGANANTLGLKFQQNNQLYFQFGTDGTTVGPALSAPFPTNKWLFVAIAYDGTNASMYYGSDTAAAQVIGSAASPGRSINLGGTACLAIGNRHSATANARGFNGWINDFRFYNGIGTPAFVESVREAALGGPPNISGMYPDGTTLMQGTNKLVFNASSFNGANITNVDLVLNGIDVSGSLVTSGPANNLSCSYTGLTPNQPANTAVITVIDNHGLSTTASATFDTFSPTNFVVEAEEFDFNSGQFIDNPDYTDGNPADANSYYGLGSVEGVDTHKGANAGIGVNCYRDIGAGTGLTTQTGVAAGELSWPKFFNLFDGSGNPIVGHMVGDWSSGEWQNYTKTFPAGKYNVYARVSAGVGATITFAQVTGGVGTASQTTTNLGTFSFTDSSYSLFRYVPLIDSLGNLAVVNLSGKSTVRATTGGGANADFYMFVPANTNLPVLSSLYPSGKYLFEPTNKFVFTVSSPITTISTANIQMTLNGSNVTSQLVFSGGPSTWNVSYTGLLLNQTYTAVISVVDALGNPIHDTITMDTWNPVFQVEAEDFDFDPSSSAISDGTGFRYIDNPVPTAPGVPAYNSYQGQVGDAGIDEFLQNGLPPYAGASPNNYRPNDPIATTTVTDTARRQFTGGAVDYNVGFLGYGFWQTYTKTWPAGTYNLYGRMASGANIGTIHESWQNVLAGWGSSSQVVQTVGTFAIPTTGGYSAYLYVPLLDRFGNYAQLTLGGTNSFRALELTDVGSYGLNINFYMLTAPRTDLPRIDNVYPDGSTLMQPASTLSFVASSLTYGINTTNIQVTLNGTNVSSQLKFSGSSASWNVSYAGLQPNTAYSAVISITDTTNQNHTATVNFDTFNPNNFTWEAEDWDLNPASSPTPNGSGLRYIDNPVPTSGTATNSYFGQIGSPGIDESTIFQNILGTYNYRASDFVSTEVTSDTARTKYQNAQLQNVNPGIVDYDVNYWTNGAWINYTRTFPAGSYFLYARLSAGNGAFSLSCAQVTSGAGTGSQVTQPLGNFTGSGTSFANWQYVQLINTNTGSPVVLSLGGVETLQMTGDYNEDANFFTLVPIVPTVTASVSGPNIILSFPTLSGANYTVYYKNNLTDPSWTQLGSQISGDGTVKSVSDAISGKRFYRLAIP